MTWHTITGAGTSTATKFFGDVMNKINDMFNGVNISDVVTINTAVPWTFQGSSLQVSDTDDSNSYDIVGGALSTDVTVTIPALSTNDTFNLIGAAQTISAVKTHSENVVFNTQSKGTVFTDTQQDPIKHQTTVANDGSIRIKAIA